MKDPQLLIIKLADFINSLSTIPGVFFAIFPATRIPIHLENQIFSRSLTSSGHKSTMILHDEYFLNLIFILLHPFGFLNMMNGLAAFLFAAAAAIIFLCCQRLFCTGHRISQQQRELHQQPYQTALLN